MVFFLMLKAFKRAHNKKSFKFRVRVTTRTVGGQGFKMCRCVDGKCNGGRCGCHRDNRKCNSKCHGGNANPNCTRK